MTVVYRQKCLCERCVGVRVGRVGRVGGVCVETHARKAGRMVPPHEMLDVSLKRQGVFLGLRSLLCH